MDILTTHPELAPGMLKLLSDSLTASQATTKELECKVAEQVCPNSYCFFTPFKYRKLASRC